jgi:hypothetical protein
MLRLARLVAVAFFASSAVAADLPRYKLPVGRVLYYSGEGSSKERGALTSDSSSKSTWRFTVVAQNPDGSARIIARSASSYSRQGRDAPERISTAILDLYPDGHYRMDRDLAMTFSPAVLFPRLPADADAAAKEWQSDVEWTGNRTTFNPQPPAGAGKFVFTGVQDGPTNRIYVTTYKSTYQFDPAKGVITRVEGEHSQDYGFHSKGTSTLKLDKEETLPADQAEALARDYATFTDAVKQYGDQMKAAREAGQGRGDH